jgi:hypothetical protein
MDIKLKAVLVLLPFIVAAYVGFSLLQPAMTDATNKENSLNDKTKENEDLLAKLAGGSKISARENELRAEIEKMRASVPKSADTDLLTIDLEKMCKDAGVNMVAMTSPKDAAAEAAPKPDAAADAAKKKSDKLKNMLKGAATPEQQSAAAASAAPAASSGGDLERSVKNIVVTGDYEGLQKLVHELETYQRVVHIDEIAFHLPPKTDAKAKVQIQDALPGEGAETGDPRLLFITMTLTSYYLP